MQTVQDTLAPVRPQILYDQYNNGLAQTLSQQANIAPQYGAVLEGRQNLALTTARQQAQDAYDQAIAKDPGNYHAAGQAANKAFAAVYANVPDQLYQTAQANAGSDYGDPGQQGQQGWSPEQLVSAYNSIFGFMKKYISGSPDMQKALMLQVSALPQYLQMKNSSDAQSQWQPPNFNDPVQAQQQYAANANAQAYAQSQYQNSNGSGLSPEVQAQLNAAMGKNPDGSDKTQ